MTTVKERFLKYVGVDTMSDEKSFAHPSTPGQKILAGELAEEMKRIGLEDVFIDENSYVYGKLPPTQGKESEPVIGFISHMDTAEAVSGKNIKPQVISDYQGGDIVLNENRRIIMKVSDFEHLKNYHGQDLIVTDGTTLLGSDDKAGIAEILTMIEKIQEEGVAHGGISVAFTPDEEIGRGTDHFQVKKFGADFAYTVDGGALGELEYENFNAASARVVVKGVNIHPGEAKNKMKNAILIAMEFNQMLPGAEIPAHTEGYEGFYHLDGIKGEVECAKMSYLVRDHDRQKFEQKKNTMMEIAAYLNRKYGEHTVEIELKDGYYNMKEMIEPHSYIIDRAKEAMARCNVIPKIVPIRGGTDGARLSYMGLPCPNLSTGGHNFHGRYEYISVQSMEKMTEVLLEIVKGK